MTQNLLRVPSSATDFEFLQKLCGWRVQDARTMVLKDEVDPEMLLPNERLHHCCTYRPLIHAFVEKSAVASDSSDRLDLLNAAAEKGWRMFREPGEYVPGSTEDQKSHVRHVLIKATLRILELTASPAAAYSLVTRLGLDENIFKHLSTKRARNDYKKWSHGLSDIELARWDELAEIYASQAARDNNAKSASRQMTTRPRMRRGGL